MGPLNWLGHRCDIIRSPLSPSACTEALSPHVDGLMTLFGKKPLIGHVGPSGGSLRKRRNERDMRTTLERVKAVAEAS